ncbi:HlyD family efflux transporter periplasmic adaptor subunit [Solimonas sp. K1W22B-7]|uniref:HlyD family secretion protein n=1 Tax=Solimonas sp. K1W22B-7 TaxID=2303331 RepID=UPI000E33007D|nr:HlyD family efflux transporter periplasmic adaptor subunit [Solimonas sp. K1W22B-7]AXQ29638.1 HlyD family efflux transporter periplasmic adaptor subunit [Solimonas sp. K1W22B-7]
MRKSILILLLMLAGCHEEKTGIYQGYVEGEPIRVAAPRAGRLDLLAVRRGDTVAAGTRLFALEAGVEKAALDEAQARLADLGKGERPEEEAVRRAQLSEAQAQAALSQKEWQRQQTLYADRVVSRERLDQAATHRDRDAARVRELQARLRAGALAGREDARRAAEAAVAQAQWQLDQKSQAATAAGLIDDLYFRAGEWVPAGAPVLALLPPGNRRLRFFVPQEALAGLQPGRRLRARCDGCAKPVEATVSRVAATAEFTPPVIYSREQRSRMVFLVEAQPAAADAAGLHPGQPVDIELLP